MKDEYDLSGMKSQKNPYASRLIGRPVGLMEEEYGTWKRWSTEGGSPVSPTLLKHAGYRFFFFSREESRMHVHVNCAEGEAKFWLEPDIELARNFRLSAAQLQEAERVIKENGDEFKAAWKRYFAG